MRDGGDAAGLGRLLPHQPPFRFVDEVLLYEPGIRLTAVWHPARVRDDYGGSPYVPDTVLIEGLAQAGVILTQLETRPLLPHEFPVLGSIYVDTERAVSWQEKVIYTLRPVRLLAKQAFLEGELTGTDGKPAVRIRLTVAISERESAPGEGAGRG